MIAKTLKRLSMISNPTVSLNDEDRADIDRLRQVQGHIAQSIELANLRDDPLRFPLHAISEVAELQLTTQIKTRQLLHRAIRAADQVNQPSEILKANISACFQQLAREQWLRFAMMASVLFTVAVLVIGTIVAFILLEAHRNSPNAEAFLAAAGRYAVPWIRLTGQNDLPSMVSACAKSQYTGPAPNGHRYCFIAVVMDGVKAEAPSPPALPGSPADGDKR